MAPTNLRELLQVLPPPEEFARLSSEEQEAYFARIPLQDRYEKEMEIMRTQHEAWMRDHEAIMVRERLQFERLVGGCAVTLGLLLASSFLEGYPWAETSCVLGACVSLVWVIRAVFR